MKTVLVTGGAGFIGSHLVDQLIADNNQVIIVDNLSTGRLQNVNKNAVLKKISIENSKELEKVFQHNSIDIVFHQAAIINTNILAENPVDDVQTSIIGTINIINCCKTYNIKRIIFASSVAVYGQPTETLLPVTEKSPLAPIYSYGICKKTAEEYIKYYAQSRGLSYAILRYVNIYGPRQPVYGEVGVISIFSKLIAKGAPITIYGDGTQMRDFLFVKDAVHATIKAMDNDENLSLIIGSGRGTTVNELFQAFQKASEEKITYKNKELRVGEIGKFFCSNLQAIEKLNWRPKTSLYEGIKITLNYEIRTYQTHDKEHC